MHFGKAISAEFFGDYPGFEPFREQAESPVMIETIRGRLTQSLNYVTADLSDETSKALPSLFGDPEEWKEVVFKPKILQLVARISSRVFLGPEICKNERWLSISKEYAVDTFIAARALRQWPSILRPIVHWFIPECRKIRAELKQAREIIIPLVNEHRQKIRWMDDTAKGRLYDVALAQLGLAFAAIHTTTEMISGLLGDLCANPEYFEPLRQEIRTVFGEKGWKKSSLHELRLMDSVMKESQRHHFGDIGKLKPARLGVSFEPLLTNIKAAMTRISEKQISLSDGTLIPKGTLTMVSIENMQDTSIFPDPNAFKGRRFLDIRERPGNENRWQFVTTSPEHLAFGHGKHACPGRFFASKEIKIALCHLLMSYDWQLPREGRKQDQIYGQETDIDPTARIQFRVRKGEIPI
ncbi:cytochrome P450 [Pyrenochaeta sp. MPI-SDFR-AT-0127]|nr:cytochrome P450 [Pyrenochaeta sp. MPI-SDFR-AT-0127]